MPNAKSIHCLVGPPGLGPLVVTVGAGAKSLHCRVVRERYHTVIGWQLDANSDRLALYVPGLIEKSHGVARASQWETIVSSTRTERRHDLQVVRVWEEVDRLHRLQMVPVAGQRGEVTGERWRVTGDVNHTSRP